MIGYRPIPMKTIALMLVLTLSLLPVMPVIPAVAAGTPIFTVSPGAWSASNLPKTVTITSDTLDTFHDGVKVVLVKQADGSNAQPVTNLISDQEINFRADALTDGVYDILINDSGALNGQYVTGKTFTVGDPALALSPASVAKNYSQPVTITVTGTNTNFANGQTIVEIYDGITKKDFVNGTPQVTSRTSLSFILNTGLTTGIYDLKIVTGDEEVIQNDVLAVRGTPAIALSPNKLSQGYAATTIAVTGTNTGFNNQSTVAILDASGNATGKAGTPTVTDATHLSFSAGTGLAVGSYTVRVTTGDEIANAALTVAAASAQLKYNGNSFEGISEGYTSAYTITFEGTNTSFNQGTTVLALYKQNGEAWDAVADKISNMTVSNTTSLTFSLATGLTGGTYKVTATTGDQTVNDTFAVNTASLSSVTFNSEVASGSTLPLGYKDTTVSVLGLNTLFTDATTVEVYQESTLQSGKVLNKAVTDSVNLSFTLVQGLTAGSYSVVIDIDGDMLTTADQLTSAFSVTAPSFAITPATVVNTSSTPMQISVTGTNTHFSKATPVVTIKDALGTSVGTISGTTVTDDTHLTFNLTPNSITDPGSYTVNIRTTKSSVLDENITQSGILTVQASGISGISPAIVYTDQLGTAAITLTGYNTAFSQGTTTVSVTDATLQETSIATVTVASATSLQFTVPEGLAAGTCTVTVNTGTIYTTNFEVRERNIALSVDTKKFEYAPFNMTVTGSGVTFDATDNRPTVQIYSGVTRVDSGITLQDTNISATQFTFAFPAGLAAGTYTVKVTWENANSAYNGLAALTDTITVQHLLSSLSIYKDGNSVDAVTVSQGAGSISLAAMGQVTGTGYVDKSALTAWSVTSGENVVSVSGGTVTLLAAGNATVQAAYDGFTDSISITVEAVAGAAAALTDVTVTDAEGMANNGKVLVTDNRADQSDALMYKVTAAKITTPSIGDLPTDFLAVPADGLIAVTAGQHISLVSVSGTPAAIVAYKDYQVDPVDELGITISGYVKKEAKPDGRHDGVQVTLEGTAYAAVTDINGYFELTGVVNGDYTMLLSVSNYLDRQVSNISVTGGGDITLSTSVSPIELWAGDFDGMTGVNATDLSTLIASFGKVFGQTGYDERADFDEVTGVNATDLSILISHFGRTSADYPVWTW